MKAKPYTKKMLKAWRETVTAYERLIETGDARGWEHYGSANPCRLCKASTTYSTTARCTDCVLGDCMGTGRLARTLYRLRWAIVGGSKAGAQSTARARLAALKRVVNPKLKHRGQLESVR